MKQSKIQQIILWITAALVIFIVASIFGWKALYGVIIPQAGNLAAFSTLGILSFAFIAGLIANFGPCSLGVLPAYMSFYLGMDEGGEKHSPVKKSVTLGIIASLGVFSFFIVLGLLFATIGTFLAVYATQLKFVIAIFILFIGIGFLYGKSIIYIPFLSSFKNKVSTMSRGRSQGISLFGFGIIYGAGGLMCFLPIFLPLVVFPLISGNFLISIVSFLIFSLAQALFLITVTVFVGAGKHTFFKVLIGKTETMKRVAGGILILTSVWMFAIFFIWGM
ncbi:hypothetical protein MYX07_07085 [Patescibacteria group bacterium AH-259-L07]|nr:hypothetical protein [Patescibacteria group bacterium AH-259-L07]